jgi:hypothetical protein
MGRNIKNLTAVDRVYDRENPIYYLVGDIIKFTYNNSIEINKTIVEKNVVIYPTEEEIKNATLAVEAKKWRNQELKNTDILSLLVDHPNNANILSYRQELRDWPNTNNFPLTKPKLK